MTTETATVLTLPTLPPGSKPQLTGELAEAFPDVDPQFKPFGGRVLIQLRVAKAKSRGGIILPDEARQTEQQLTCIGRIVDYGPLAYHNRTTGEPWPEGQWAERGSFVRLMQHGGGRFTLPIPGRPGETVTFAILNDYELVGAYEGDPLDVTAYV